MRVIYPYRGKKAKRKKTLGLSRRLEPKHVDVSQSFHSGGIFPKYSVFLGGGEGMRIVRVR